MGGIAPSDTAREGWWQSREQAVFRVTGLTGRRIRVLSIHHEQRKLAGTLAVRDNEPGPLVARLRPWGAVSGRLVDREGRPRPGVRLSYRGPADVNRGTAPPFPRDVTTDREGRFAVEGLVPGLEYVLRIAVDDGLGPRRQGPSPRTRRGRKPRRCPGGAMIEAPGGSAVRNGEAVKESIQHQRFNI